MRLCALWEREIQRTHWCNWTSDGKNCIGCRENLFCRLCGPLYISCFDKWFIEPRVFAAYRTWAKTAIFFQHFKWSANRWVFALSYIIHLIFNISLREVNNTFPTCRYFSRSFYFDLVFFFRSDEKRFCACEIEDARAGTPFVQFCIAFISLPNWNAFCRIACFFLCFAAARDDQDSKFQPRCWYQRKRICVNESIPILFFDQYSNYTERKKNQIGHKSRSLILSI